MVDIGVTRPVQFAKRLEGVPSDVVIELRPADDVALSDYESFCRTAIHAPAQHPLWLRCWVMATGADVLILTLRRGSVPAIALALEVVREGPFRIARFPGGHHANGNFIATGHGWTHPLTEEDARSITAAIHEARPDIDLIFLERQNPQQDGITNPLADLATMRSPNVSLAVDLAGGFDAVLARNGGKRKRKKYRNQLRKFEEAGGYQVLSALTGSEASRFIDSFFEMKAARFQEKGISNVFAPVEVQSFFRMLFQEALEAKEPPFLLYGLEVGGQLLAIKGCSRTAHSVVCEFGSIVEMVDRSSPGYFLDYACMEEACRNGLSLYDFSVGDEDYKRSWCDVETTQFDTLLPLTARGRVAWALEMARAHAVRLVKSNNALWSLVKQARTRFAGGKPPQDD